MSHPCSGCLTSEVASLNSSCITELAGSCVGLQGASKELLKAMGVRSARMVDAGGPDGGGAGGASPKKGASVAGVAKAKVLASKAATSLARSQSTARQGGAPPRATAANGGVEKATKKGSGSNTSGKASVKAEKDKVAARADE